MGWLVRFLEWFPSPPKIPVMAHIRKVEQERLAASQGDIEEEREKRCRIHTAIMAREDAARERRIKESFDKGAALAAKLRVLPPHCKFSVPPSYMPLLPCDRDALAALATNRGITMFHDYFNNTWEFTR